MGAPALAAVRASARRRRAVGAGRPLHRFKNEAVDAGEGASARRGPDMARRSGRRVGISPLGETFFFTYFKLVLCPLFSASIECACKGRPKTC